MQHYHLAQRVFLKEKIAPKHNFREEIDSVVKNDLRVLNSQILKKYKKILTYV